MIMTGNDTTPRNSVNEGNLEENLERTKAETNDLWTYLLVKPSRSQTLKTMPDQLYRKHIGFMGTRSNPTAGSFLLLDFFHIGKPVMPIFPITSSSWKFECHNWNSKKMLTGKKRQNIYEQLWFVCTCISTEIFLRRIAIDVDQWILSGTRCEMHQIWRNSWCSFYFFTVLFTPVTTFTFHIFCIGQHDSARFLLKKFPAS